MTYLVCAMSGCWVGLLWRDDDAVPVTAVDHVMANRRIDMRQIRQVLRLAFEDNVSRRAISASLGLHRDTVRDYLVRAAAAKLTWPLPSNIDDAALEDILFPPASQRSTQKPQPDWKTVHVELKKKGATLQGLHAEYLEDHPDGLAYSRYCDAYRK